MTKTEFMQWLSHVEATFHVATWRINSIHVWPLIRLQLFGLNFEAMVVKESVVGSWSDKIKTVVGSLVSWAWAVIVDWRNNVRPDTPADAVFLTTSYGSQPTIDGRKYNPLLAPYVELVSRLGKRSMVWEMCPHVRYNIPRFSPSFFIQMHLLFLRIVSLFARGAKRADDVYLEGFSEFVKFTAASNLKLRYANLDALTRDVFFVLRLAEVFKRWLVRIQPSHGFIVDHWLREHAFCLACRELGITSVEIQHGVQDELHPAYACWSALPAHGYETLAEVYWCWDEPSAWTINQWASRSKACVAIVGGEPWREMWFDENADIVKRFDGDIARHKGEFGNAKQILLVLDYAGPVIPQIVIDALRRSPGNWCYWVRLHPVDYRVRLPEASRILNENGIKHFDVEYVTQLPLHSILRHVDVHVTVSWSSVVLQAEDFGVPSVACAMPAAEIYPRQFEEGTLKVADSPNQILDSIQYQLGNRLNRPNRSRPHPDEAMRRLLANSVISKKGDDELMEPGLSAFSQR